MIKKSTLFLIVFLMAFHVFADGITKNQAQNVAQAFLHSRLADNTQSGPKELTINSVQVIGDVVPLFYAINFQAAGFVLVSATDAAIPVLGYSPVGQYSYENQSPSMVQWIAGYKQQLNEIIDQQLLPTPKISAAWNDLISYNPEQSNNRNLREVEPLLPSLWNQGSPYNKLCPLDDAGPGGRVYAGCVATAMSQVMYYWRYPLQGTGSHGYYSDYGYLSANFGETEYKYEEMTNVIASSDYFEMNQIQYHCGIAVDMMYAPDGSGAYSSDAATAMRNYFGYSNTTSLASKSNYSDAEWADLLMQNLDNGWPMYYDGYGTGGHAFNVDGYQGNDYFHFNWGWGGSANGYFYLNNLNPSGNDFTSWQGAIVNCYPAANNYPSYCDGPKTLTHKDGTIEDGSGPVKNYISGQNCGWLIAPFDSVTGLTLNFERFDLTEGIDVLNIFDGPDASYPLLASLSGNAKPAQLTATGDRMFIEFLTSGDQGGGFRLSYQSTTVVYCEGTTLLTDSEGIISDGSGNRNYNHNSMCKYRIAPEGAQSITLNFNYLDTEPENDVIKVYNLANQELVATYSGNEIPESLTVPSGKVMLLFVSDADVSAYGWEVEYTSSSLVSVPLESLTAALRVQAYPVPATDWLRVKLESSLVTDVSLYICDISGRVLMHNENVNFSGQKTEMLGIDHLAAGIYFLKYTSDAGSGSLKIVVSK